MNYVNYDALTESDWLAERLNDPEGHPDLRVVDASFHLDPARDARAEFTAAHIPGAVFFDIEEICDSGNPLPHMLPRPEIFAAAVGRLGLGKDADIVVYDSDSRMAAARVWYMFRVFGHDRVAVLNGGLPKWRQEGRPVESGNPDPAAAEFTPRFDSTLVRDADAIFANIGTGAEQIVDVRAAGRFYGTAPEPRPGMRSGHMPGALNLPFGDLLDPDTGVYLPAEALRRCMDTAGIDFDRPIVTSCGSGVSAANLTLALYLLGRRDVAIYDGSWAEWGGRDDTPIERNTDKDRGGTA